VNEAKSNTGLSVGPAAEDLAGRHQLASGQPEAIDAWSHLRDTEAWLRSARLIATSGPEEAGKAAEWLLDNDYQIHRALRQIRKDLPRTFYSRLPALSSPGDECLPRIFMVAHEFLHCSRLQVSLDGTVEYATAYQRIAPLSIAELWAFPTMLRIACIEILVASLTPLLGQGLWLPFKPSKAACDRLSLEDSERAARAIANLAQIAVIPWNDFFDRSSLVQETLKGDPSGFYGLMDFESRDRYRRAVEEIAAWSRQDEISVAAQAVSIACSACAEERKGHIGYWLAAEGRPEFERTLGARAPLRKRLDRFILAHPGLAYGAGLALAGLLALLLPAIYLLIIWPGILLGLLALLLILVPASILAIAFLNLIITRTIPVWTLFKLDLSKGLPPDCKTLVALPVIVADAAEVPSLAEQAETHWLSNAGANLQVALLVDLADATQERLPPDESIEAALKDEVRRLNAHYGAREEDGPFHLLIRPRLYNEAQDCWMAWERKRGKLEQLNRMLVENDDSGFSTHVGNRAALEGTRFVVTVDADTLLPPGTVAQLAGALAHPLNRASFDPATGRLDTGYSIIQPRVEISPQSGEQTLFTRLFTGDTAIDIYSRAVSDVYQDLFGAGIFVGKGIYDVAAFHRSVDGLVPENAILSHDLFEGAHGRVALASDIVLYEGFPARYLDYVRRLHRWIRGDWQLIGWLRGTVRRADGMKQPNRISGIDRWKILDNLRRSLVSPALVLTALGGWLFLPGSPWFWTMLVLFAPGGQLFVDLVSGLARGRRRGAVHGLFANLVNQAGRWFLALAYMLHEALVSLHAIAVTLWRLVRRRKLLEWTSAAHAAGRASGRGRPAIWRQMWHGPVLALTMAAVLAFIHPASLWASLPLLALWVGAPEITFRIDRPRIRDTEPLRPEDITFLRLLARRTWFYFETFAGPEDNWLPPDNYQEEPRREVAHRTSPTNVGMMLLSTAAAWDLGYIGRSELGARVSNALESMARLERYRGHFFNWYDTRTLAPLEPRYVSTVDSGNLAMCLLALAAALREAQEQAPVEPQRWRGLEDTAALLDVALASLPAGGGPLRSMLKDCRRQLGEAEASDDPRDAIEHLLSEQVPALEAALADLRVQRVEAPLDSFRDAFGWLERLGYQIRSLRRDLPGAEDGQSLLLLAEEVETLAYEMDLKLLYDAERRLFRIGHNVSMGRTDPHHYDLLASEARLASFFAIAKGDAPVEHWFHLQRPVIRVSKGIVLLSWNGSMFEYLMPRLLIRPGPETLLEESDRIATEVQRRHGASRGTPWGISESAYSAMDPDHRYRYQAFGVPDLGLRRGLGADLVVAPYASALALAISPALASSNLRKLSEFGALRRFGFIEAVDFTRERVGHNGFTLVVTHMAHHQGMILGAIANALLADRMVERLAQEPCVRTVLLLLSERVPRHVPTEIPRLTERDRPQRPARPVHAPPPYEPLPLPFCPQIHLMGNGQLSSWISDGGGGGLRWHRNALTRFNADPTRDADGLWIFVADDESGALWSATRQPTASQPVDYRTLFHPHMAEFHRRDEEIHTSLEVAVASGVDLEVRRLLVVNESDRARRLRITSYGEVVLAPAVEDERHPAFSKLFVGAEQVPHLNGLLSTRRARSPDETPPTMLHFIVPSESPTDGLLFECDRRNFLGRNRSVRDPLGARADLSNRAGWTLDPVVALQLKLQLKPYERREICFVTIAAASREAAIDAAERHNTLAALDWVIADASSEAGRAFERSRLAPDAWSLAGTIASCLVYPGGSLRATPETIRANQLGQSNLWGLGISGDLPILLLRTVASDANNLQTLFSAHQLWRRHGLEADLVIIQTSGSAYAEPLRDQVGALLGELGLDAMLGRNGGVHLVFADQIGPEQARLLEASARVVIDEEQGGLATALERALEPRAELPQFTPSRPAEYPEGPSSAASVETLSFDNGLGGFTRGGREYVVRLAPHQSTPAPWSNIIANDAFGCLVTEAGGGFSWALNSGENRLTPWTNDPVTDRAVEALYLRDEETAAVWTITPSPAGRDHACEVRHGAGYTTWRKNSHALKQEMTILVPPEAPVKLVRLRLTNSIDRHRRLTATYFAEWLLGALPTNSRERVHCEFDAEAGAIFARSDWNAEFAGRVAFLGSSLPAHGFTTNRLEFVGREGDLSDPASLRRWGLSGATRAGEDPCAAYQVHVELGPGEQADLVFVLGQGADETEARSLIAKWTRLEEAQAGRVAIERHWDSILGAVEVSTSDPAFDIMVNHWLLYQCLSSRLLARAGLYQAGGAVGFRDQLQDVLALLHVMPGRARDHILLCAASQFEEGDVLHWWHPPSGRGVRTRFSDDLVWLPYATATYVEATGDLSILDERVPFLSAPALTSDEEDRYARFEPGATDGSLLDHCHRALERAYTRGAHGLPLIGSGDWNDGMNRLGREGRGESVWLAWFITVTAERIAALDRRLGHDSLAEMWRDRAGDLRRRAEEAGWDGAWYRRAYDDNGHPIGAARNAECRIDSISQSWSRFAGADEARSRQALESAERELIDPEANIARLLWPPFDRSIGDPGYIKAYPPGIRENGGQYSHAAAWLGIAFAQAGDGAKAKTFFDMLNPILRAMDPAAAELYRVEPYVAAADIAAVEPHTGRGGWTWYTGSAAWAWRLGVEAILGLRRVDGKLSIAPCLPAGWRGYEARLRGGKGDIIVRLTDPDRLGSGRVEIKVNGKKRTKDLLVDFPNDGSVTEVDAKLVGQSKR